MKGFRKTLSQQRQEVIAKYRAEHGDRPASMAEIARWALEHGLIGRSKVDLIQQVARELSRAAREEMETDPQATRS
jgi:hypothetical protein